MKVWFFFIQKKAIILPESTEKYLQNKKGFIIAGWHNQIMSLTGHCSSYLQKKRGVSLTPLVSHSKDGEMIFLTFRRFGMESVRGSTSKGGSAALRQLLKLLKEGKVPIFTPDGPRGPIFKVQPGVIQIASVTKLPIITFYARFASFHEFKSWDKHRFPKFGTKMWIDYSEPFFVPEKIENYEEYALQLENKMLEQMKRLDTLVEEELKK